MEFKKPNFNETDPILSNTGIQFSLGKALDGELDEDELSIQASIQFLSAEHDEQLKELIRIFGDEISGGDKFTEGAEYGFGVFIGEKMIGFELSSIREEENSLIGKGIYVLDNYRGNSIAKKLLTQTIKLAIRLGCKRPCLDKLQKKRAYTLDHFSASNRKSGLIPGHEILFEAGRTEQYSYYDIRIKENMEEEDFNLKKMKVQRWLESYE